jgi:pseudouridine-5'-phosphate glycosidase
MESSINRRQIRAGRLIAAVIVQAAAQTDTPLAVLPKLAAAMSFDQWRTLAFTVDLPVPDEGVKLATIAILNGLKGGSL